MKRTIAIALSMNAAGLVCLAQDNTMLLKQKIEAELASQMKVVSLRGSMMGSVVKNAAYSGIEISERTQTLADGTVIRNETQTKVFRDNAGRVRREGAHEINIWDPVNQVSYSLNPETLKAQKLPFASSANVIAGKDGTSITLRTLQGNSETKLEAESVARGIALASQSAEAIRNKIATRVEADSEQKFVTVPDSGPAVSLGSQNFDGVRAEGKRQTRVLPVNAIGNDRPITITTERWYSPELSLNVMTKNVDPRLGENSFRLTNISRDEPTAYLFQVPPGYQVVERK